MNNTQLYDNTHLLNPKLMIGNISIHWKHDRNKCLGQKRKSLFPVPRLTLAQFPRLMTTFVLKTLSFSRSEKKKKGLPTNRPTLLFSTKEPEINFFFCLTNMELVAIFWLNHMNCQTLLKQEGTKSLKLSKLSLFFIYWALWGQISIHSGHPKSTAMTRNRLFGHMAGSSHNVQVLSVENTHL